MTEIYKALSDFTLRKKELSQKSYARLVAVAQSDHTEQDFQDAVLKYFEASGAYLALSEMMIELIDKGLI